MQCLCSPIKEALQSCSMGVLPTKSLIWSHTCIRCYVMASVQQRHMGACTEHSGDAAEPLRSVTNAQATR